MTQANCVLPADLLKCAVLMARKLYSSLAVQRITAVVTDFLDDTLVDDALSFQLGWSLHYIQKKQYCRYSQIWKKSVYF